MWMKLLQAAIFVGVGGYAVQSDMFPNPMFPMIVAGCLAWFVTVLIVAFQDLRRRVARRQAAWGLSTVRDVDLKK
jgi:hypothetical protein